MENTKQCQLEILRAIGMEYIAHVEKNVARKILECEKLFKK